MSNEHLLLLVELIDMDITRKEGILQVMVKHEKAREKYEREISTRKEIRKKIMGLMEY